MDPQALYSVMNGSQPQLLHGKTCIELKLSAGQDYYRDRDARLSSMPLKAFMGLIFQHCPGLAPFAAQRDAIHAQVCASGL